MKKRKLCRFVSAMMASMLLVTELPGGIVVHAEGQNVAEGKNVYAVAAKAGTAAENVTDGDLLTTWESGNDWNRWVEIDLEGTYNIHGVRVHVPENTIETFHVYASNDNVNFTKVASQSEEIKAEGGYQLNFEDTEAAKIRIAVTYNNTSNLASISEVEVFGDLISSEIIKVPEIHTENFDETVWAERMQARRDDKSLLDKEVVEESYALVDRVLGTGYHTQFVFEVAPIGVDGKDAFIVETSDGKIKITGPNGISLASGFNWYLKNTAHLNYDPLCVSNLNAPEKLPLPETKTAKETPYDYKYALNFCTFSYTMAFWDWEEYEPFLDWCAMNGINLLLDVVGQEEVQRRTLNAYGYSDQDVKEYLTGPGYYAWLYMGNMQSFGGPLPDNWFEQRTELARQIHDRMSIYGIQPVFLGYAGKVPVGFEKKNPDAQIIDQGSWSGFHQPSMLRTYVTSGEDYFSKVADTYYEELHNVFGDITNFYAIDPFHEGGRPADLNMTQVASTVQGKMQAHDPDAVWVLQNWQSNPTNNLIKGLNKEKSLILDLYADNQPNHFNRNEYNGGSGEGTPWIWNMLHSFGGRMGFNGMPEILAAIPEDLDKANYMAGIGVTAESLATNPMLYEMIYDMGWENNTVNVEDYIADYFHSRYGVRSDNIEKAWDIMRDTAYFKRRDRQRAEDSIINARPGFGVTKACIYYTAEIDYDKAQFEEILKLYLTEYDNLKNNEAYLYDLADITRQVLANASYEYYRAFEDAWLAQDYETFKEMSDKFIEIVELQDRVLSTQDEFLVGKWIDNARNLLADADDWTKDLFEFNARAQISSWGGQSAANGGGLHDYSNRQWNGITGTLYKERWQTWIDRLDDAALNKAWARPGVSANEWFDIEYKWANKSGNEFITEASNEDLSILGQQALDQYSVTKISKTNTEQRVNIALNKNTETNTAEKRPSSQAVDGKQDTLWVGAEYPSELIVDLDGTYAVDGIDLYFERPAEDMSNPVVFAYKIEVLNENDEWITVVDQSENIEIKSYVVKEAYKGQVKKVKVTIPTADLELRPLVLPAIAELYVWKADDVDFSKLVYNAALEGTATASRNAPNPDRVAAKVNDGNLNSFWAAGTGVFPQWVQVDLGKEMNLSKLAVAFEKAANDFKYQVDLYADDGTTLVGTIDQNNDEVKPKITTFEEGYNGVRYIKVTINGVRAGGTAWPAVAEIQAWTKQESLLSEDGVTVTAADETNIANLYDGNKETYWTANEGNKEIIADLGKSYELDYTSLSADSAVNYDLMVSEDGVTYTLISNTKQEAGTSLKVYFRGEKARYVKYVINNEEDVNINEIILFKNDYTSILNSYITKYEKKLNNVTVGEYSGMYLQSDYDEMINKFEEYKSMDFGTLGREEVEAVKEEIFDLYTQFIGKSIVINKNELLVHIKQSQQLLDNNQAHAESEKFKQLVSAVETARTVYDTFSVTQDAVNEASDNLAVSEEAFRQYADKAALQKAINEAEALEETKYTEVSWAELQNVLNIAKDVYADSEASKAEIDEVTESLETAMINLKRVFVVTVNDKVAGKGVYNTKVTVTAPTVEGKDFTGWKLNDKVVSTKAEYTFFISEDMELTPCYEEVKIEPSAMLTNTIVTKREDGRNDIKFVAQLIIPEGYTIEEAGLVWSNQGEDYNDESKLDIEKFGSDPSVKVTKISRISNTWQYSVTIKGVPGTVKCVPGRAYAKLVKGDGTTVQSEIRLGYTK